MEMDQALVDNWNSVVTRKDLVYHLGDFAWSHPPEAYLRRLNGKVILILGNHDRRNRCIKAGFKDVKELALVSVNSRPIFLFHYPCMSWPSRTFKSWHLFGHVHGRLEGKRPKLSLDVGVDVHGFRPVSYDEVKKLIESESSKYESTNSSESSGIRLD